MSSPIRQYEARFASLVGAPVCRAFTRGRMGLYVSLRALGVGTGDRVGVCAYTCLSVVEAVLRTGATCEFLDVDEWLNPSPQSLARLPEGRIRALVTQYTFGVPSQLDEVLQWARARSVPVIEDCCHAFGSRWGGRHVGSFGAAAIYSTEWGKNYSTGQGGMLTVNDESLARAIDRILESEALPMRWASDCSLSLQRVAHAFLGGPGTIGALRAAHRLACRVGLASGSFAVDLDFSNNTNFLTRAGTGLARAGLRQLARWPRTQARRTENARRLADRFSQAGIPVPPFPPKADPVPQRFVLRTGDKERVLREAAGRGIPLAGWYRSVVHPLGPDQLAAVGYTGQCPLAERAIGAVVHLPTARSVPGRKIEALIKSICWKAQ